MDQIFKKAKSIRTFVGAKDYERSRRFYSDLGFTEHKIDAKMSFFKVNTDLGFYLQDYYVGKWCDNSMVLLEIANVDELYQDLKDSGVEKRYKNVKISPIKESEHGKQIFMHDPSGVLWHFFEFSPSV